jgi:Family of unknown function (DUF6236)
MPNMIINKLDAPIQSSVEIPEETIDLDYLYSCLLFFDKVAVLNPSKEPAFFRMGVPRAFHDTPRQHLLELREAGVLRAFDYPPGGFDEVLTTYRQFLADKWDGHDWLVHPSLVLPSAPRDLKYAALRVELVDGFAFPSANIHIDDILQFRSQRSDQLSRLWAELYAATQNVDFDDKAGRLSVERDRLEQAVKEYDAVASERWVDRVKRSAAFSIQFGSDTVVAIVAAAATTGTGLDWLAVLQVNASIFRFGVDLARLEPPTQRVRGISYLSEAAGKFPPLR